MGNCIDTSVPNSENCLPKINLKYSVRNIKHPSKKLDIAIELNFDVYNFDESKFKLVIIFSLAVSNYKKLDL